MTGLDDPQERLALLGYLAGIIDGEGYIGLHRQVCVSARGTRYPSFRPVVVVTLVGKEPIEEIDRICRTLELPSYYSHLKESSRWGIAGQKRVGAFLTVLAPFLRIKRRQAGLVLEYIRERNSRPYHSSPSAEARQLSQSVSALNTKGKNPQRLYAESR